MPSRHRLQQYAIAISILSLLYNTAEGVVSIVFGAESSSHALVFYGLQSAVEVISDLLVTWRFLDAFKSDDMTESLNKTSPKTVRVERIATITNGGLLVVLTIAAVITSAASLAAHERPSTALPAILIAAASISFTFLLYLCKRYLAHALDSSALNGEAICGLCCMELSAVLLIGSLIYRVWKGGWWVDAATTIIIGLIFGWEGAKMIRLAQEKDFDGGFRGCSKDTASSGNEPPTVEVEKPKEPEQNQSRCSSSARCCEPSAKEEPVNGEQV